MNNARATNVSLKPAGLLAKGVFDWSWGGWEKCLVVEDIYLFSNGFVTRNEEESSLNRSCNADTWGASVVDLYRHKGRAFVNDLRGSFALVLWDAQRHTLFLATDHFGTRPIYYLVAKGQIAFAPRMASFMHAPEIRREIEPNSLYFYLNHSFIPAPFTVFKNIRRLEPGHILEWSTRGSTVRRYWDMFYVEDPHLSESAAAESVRKSLEDSVRFAMCETSISTKRVGAFLSGGTDSSTLVGLMAKFSPQQTHSFSVGFEEEAYNELHYARIAARHFGSLAHEYIVRPDEALSAVSELAAAYDEPFGNSSAVPTYFCVKMAKEEGIGVLFAGDGGDELFGGNERYITEKVFAIYQQAPRPLRKIFESVVGQSPDFYPLRKVHNYVRKANQPAMDRFFAYQLYYRDHAAEFLTDDFRSLLEHDFPIDIARQHYLRSTQSSPLNRLLYVDLKLAVSDNDLFKVNRMAERHGVEVRYPFLDRRVGTVSGNIPAGLKVKGWSKRYIFKKAFERFLPREILTKKKHGFGLPTGDWLRTHSGFRDLARSLLLDPRSVQRGYFQRPALERLLKAHDEERSGYFGSHIWNFMMLELWHRTHADRTSASKW